MDKDFRSLNNAMRVSLPTIETDINAIKSGIDRLRIEITKSGGEFGERLQDYVHEAEVVFRTGACCWQCPRVAAWPCVAGERCVCVSAGAVDDEYKAATREFAATCRFLGEAPSSSPEEVFGPLHAFMKDFDNTRTKVHCALF